MLFIKKATLFCEIVAWLGKNALVWGGDIVWGFLTHIKHFFPHSSELQVGLILVQPNLYKP